ncbi:MAG TPA: hypothetical protein PKM64_02235 [Thermoanaerobaculia bacterium]|jgi:hypothetical protein|nr:hypothetical protein [Thermoanaerobaculia bacterium]
MASSSRFDPSPAPAAFGYWSALAARYPAGSRWELVRPATAVVVANFLAGKALLRGELQPVELVLLVALEAVLLSAISWIQYFSVPAAARPDAQQPRMSPLERLRALLIGLLWLGIVYGVVFVYLLRQPPEWHTLAPGPLGFFRTSAIRWPLAATAGGALLDAFADRAFWHRRGGTFVSTPGFTGLARWLTLVLGGVPFFVPMALGLGGVLALLQRGERRLRGRDGSAGTERAPSIQLRIALLVLVPVGVAGVFRGLRWLTTAGPDGWMIGYLAAKLLAELALLGLPFLARQEAAAEREVRSRGVTRERTEPRPRREGRRRPQ